MKIVLSDEGANINLLKSPYLTEGLSLAIIGNKGSGKSWTLAVLAEEAHRNHVPFIYYDVNGDAASLRELGDDVVVIGREHGQALRCAHYAIDDAEREDHLFVPGLDDVFSAHVSGIRNCYFGLDSYFFQFLMNHFDSVLIALVRLAHGYVIYYLERVFLLAGFRDLNLVSRALVPAVCGVRVARILKRLSSGILRILQGRE